MIIVRQTESSVQKIIGHLRHWMPLLAVLCVTMCAWDVSATMPEVVHTAEAPPTLQPPSITVNIAARRLYLSWLRVFRRANTAHLGHSEGHER